MESARRSGSKAYVADITDPSLSGKLGTFDSVLCFNVLEHILDDEGALKNLGALLTRGGVIFVSSSQLSRFYLDKWTLWRDTIDATQSSPYDS
ncbi:MAG: class I SAM-dependent methyltransferase [Holosporales bacterium]|nr:class I SAM-dependent methyltransferase [Holosporales bacterium]